MLLLRLTKRPVIHGLGVLAIVFISLWPRSTVDAWVPDAVQSQEQWIHIGCYLFLAALSLWTYGNRKRPIPSRVITWCGCTAFGVLLEILQATLPGVNRSGNLPDALANAFGAVLGLLLPRLLWPAACSVTAK